MLCALIVHFNQISIQGNDNVDFRVHEGEKMMIKKGEGLHRDVGAGCGRKGSQNWIRLNGNWKGYEGNNVFYIQGYFNNL